MLNKDMFETDNGIITAYKGNRRVLSIDDYTIKSVGAGVFRYNQDIEELYINYMPDEIQEYAFFDCKNLKSVSFTNFASTKKIGKAAFGSCKKLEHINLPQKLESIDEDAFRYCESLTVIEIPKSVQTIGYSAFSDCKNLTIYCPGRESCPQSWAKSLWLGENSDNAPRVIWNKTMAEDEENVKNAFTSSASEDFEIKDGVLLKYNSKNTVIEIPDSVQEIASEAFSLNAFIMKVIIPEGVTVILNNSFRQCQNLSEVVFKGNVIRICSDAFFGCSSLKSITLPDSLIEIQASAFYSTGLQKIHIPKKVEKIGKNAFCLCTSLAEITVDSENDYFTAEDNTLYSKDMKRLLAQATVREKDYFYIPKTVVSLDDYALSNSSLKSIYIPKTLKTLSDRAITGIDLKYYCEAKKKPKGWQITNYSGLFSMSKEKTFWNSKEIPPENIPVTFEDGVTYSHDKTVLLKYPEGTREKDQKPVSYVIPNTVKKVKYNAMLTSKINNLVIPKSVTVIEENAIRLFCSGCTIYCEAKKAPKGWHKNCFGDEKVREFVKIIWGAKIEK